jgi:hypothetical protein
VARGLEGGLKHLYEVLEVERGGIRCLLRDPALHAAICFDLDPGKVSLKPLAVFRGRLRSALSAFAKGSDVWRLERMLLESLLASGVVRLVPPPGRGLEAEIGEWMVRLGTEAKIECLKQLPEAAKRLAEEGGGRRP